MIKNKSVVVSAVVHAKAEYNFHFEFDGDTSDEDAMKAAAWEALHQETTLGPLECVDHEFVDEENNNTAIEIEVVDGSPDDYRPVPKKPSKAKLWRRVARLVGELILSRGPGEYPGRIGFGLCEVVVRDVIRAWGDEPSRISKKQSRILAKLKSAFAAWEAAQ